MTRVHRFLALAPIVPLLLVALSTAHGAPQPTYLPKGTLALRAQGWGNHRSNVFTAAAPWQLRWAVRCSTPAHFSLAVFAVGTRKPIRTITRRALRAYGSTAMTHSGSFFLRITTPCAWTVRVVRLAPPVPTDAAPSPTSTVLPTVTPTAVPSPTPTAVPSPTPTAVVPSRDLALRVSGNSILDAAGNPVHLLGVNVTFSAQCIPTGPHVTPGIFAMPSLSETATAIAGWHANVVRVTLNEDCWLGLNSANPAYSGAPYRQAVQSFVSDLHTRGLYAIVDMHTNAPGAIPASSPQVMADADHALAFWSSVADTFKGDPGTILEPYNEPHITTTNAQTSNPWQCWLDGCLINETDQTGNKPIPGATPWQSAGMQSMVDAIRATGATNPVLIDGLNWAQDDSQLARYLPTDPRHALIADYHNYMSPGSRNTLQYWNTVIAPLAAQMPVVSSEVGEKDCGSSYVTDYMQWADAHNVGYIPWLWMTWDCRAMGLISDWSGTPSSYGRVFYDHFHELAP